MVRIWLILNKTTNDQIQAQEPETVIITLGTGWLRIYIGTTQHIDVNIIRYDSYFNISNVTENEDCILGICFYVVLEYKQLLVERQFP